MGIGAGVFMLAAGAIIAFAFNIRVGWLDLDVVGWVLMAAGALGLIFSLMSVTRRRTVVTNQVTPTAPTMPVAGQQTGQQVVEEQAPYDANRPY